MALCVQVAGCYGQLENTTKSKNLCTVHKGAVALEDDSGNLICFKDHNYKLEVMTGRSSGLAVLYLGVCVRPLPFPVRPCAVPLHLQALELLGLLLLEVLEMLPAHRTRSGSEPFVLLASAFECVPRRIVQLVQRLEQRASSKGACTGLAGFKPQCSLRRRTTLALHPRRLVAAAQASPTLATLAMAWARCG